jgi:hypothetical protein
MIGNHNPFRFKCDADVAGCIFGSSDQVSVTVGQSILRDGAEQIWDFVLVLSRRDYAGVLTTRVLLCNPDWDEPLEIVAVESDHEKVRVQINGSPSDGT